MRALSPWTEPRVQQLEHLYRRGLSFSLIAADIGVTRGAAIGKAHRLQLPRRISILQCKARPPAKPPAPRHRRKATIMEAVKPPEPDPDIDYRCSIYDLTNKCCRWPLWKASAAHEQRLYCGVPTASVTKGIPYCRRHTSRNFASFVNAS